MSIYAIGDLHLSADNSKPMDIFGESWKNHTEKIKKNWQEKITNNDLVILPGDFAWEMNLKDMYLDFKYINDLPGIKVLTKGNHDYWWTTLKKMNDFITDNKFKNIYFINNNAIEYENYCIVGTRGWDFKENSELEKMQNRELMRLRNSIEYAISNFGGKEIICALHYPPITKKMIEDNEKSPYLEMLKEYHIRVCIYGHLHGKSHIEAVEGNIDGIELKLVSSDYLKFNPLLLC